MSIVTINDEHLTNIADAIRRKNGTDNTYTPDKMADAIKNIQGGAEPILQEVMVFPKTEEIIITPSEDFDGISKVIVNPVTSDIDSDIKSSNIKKGVNILGVSGTLEEGITPTGIKTITDNGEYDVTNFANASVNVPKGITPTGEIAISVNGAYDVTNYASAKVEVEGSSGKYAPRYIRFQNYNGTELESEFAGLDTSRLTTMSQFCYGCTNLTKADLSGFDMSNVTTINQAFASCISLTEVIFPETEANKLLTAESTFNGLTKLTKADFSRFKTNSLKSVSNLFNNCSQLTYLDLSGFDTKNTKTFDRVFAQCSALQHLDIRNFSFGNASSWTSAFYKVPVNCLIIVKDNTVKNFVLNQRSDLINVKTVAEYQAEGGV